MTFEFGNWQQAIQKIQSVLGEDVDPLAYNWIDSSYESQPYPEPSLQTSYTRYLSQEELAALKAGLLYEKPFEESLYIKGLWTVCIRYGVGQKCEVRAGEAAVFL